MLERMIGNVVISEEDSVMYVVISKAKNTCFMGN
jgi:hypothetical protein